MTAKHSEAFIEQALVKVLSRGEHDQVDRGGPEHELPHLKKLDEE